MDRRQFLASATLVTVLPARLLAAETGTDWVVRGSEGYDAISFLGPLSGDPFYARYYAEEIGAFAPLLGEAVIEDIKAAKQELADGGLLIGPFLNLIFSSGHDATIASMLRALDEAEAVLKPPYQVSRYWSQSSWEKFTSVTPRLRTVLLALREAGFPSFWQERVTAPLMARMADLVPKLAAFDVVPELERYTARAFSPHIEVVLLEFCKPHGIKVQGQQFLSAIDWSDDIVIRTAGHELLHPPVDMNGPAALAALAVLRRDPLIPRIVEEHDPAFGYNSLAGLFDEDLASAVDQVIAERLGVARDPAERWTQVDDGMHVLAAGFYGLMKRTGFAERGGDLEAWLHRLATGGWLAPTSLHGAAAGVLGRPAGRLWPAG